MSQPIEEEERDQKDTLVEGIQDLWKRGRLFDVILVARGREFPAHKLVLSASSTFFERLFLGGFREVGQERVSIDYDPALVDLVLRYIYYESIFLIPEYKTSPIFALEKALVYFGVKSFDPKPLIMIRFESIDQTKVNASFKALTDFVSYVYPLGIPEDVIDHLASLLIPQGTEATPDLVDYDDGFITALLTSQGYRPRNIFTIYELIKRLVERRHSRDLLTLINYNKFPPETRSQLPPEFLANYNKGGPLPNLGHSIRLNAPIFVVAEEPMTMTTGIFSTKFIDDFGRIWNGVINAIGWSGQIDAPPKLGDIGTGYFTMTEQAATPTEQLHPLVGIGQNELTFSAPGQPRTEYKIDLATNPYFLQFFIRANWTSKY